MSLNPEGEVIFFALFVLKLFFSSRFKMDCHQNFLLDGIKLE